MVSWSATSANDMMRRRLFSCTSFVFGTYKFDLLNRNVRNANVKFTRSAAPSSQRSVSLNLTVDNIFLFVYVFQLAAAVNVVIYINCLKFRSVLSLDLFELLFIAQFDCDNPFFRVAVCVAVVVLQIMNNSKLSLPISKISYILSMPAISVDSFNSYKHTTCNREETPAVDFYLVSFLF